MTRPTPAKDSDINKGAAETETPRGQSTNNPKRPDIHGNLADQLPHRESGNQTEDLTGNNGTDFPEPGSSPEHSGEKSS